MERNLYRERYGRRTTHTYACLVFWNIYDSMFFLVAKKIVLLFFFQLP